MYSFVLSVSFQSEYRRLAEQCKNYSVELLDLCQSTEEIVAILNEGAEVEEQTEEQEQDAEHPTLSRVKLALKYDQKRVGTFNRIYYTSVFCA